MRMSRRARDEDSVTPYWFAASYFGWEIIFRRSARVITAASVRGFRWGILPLLGGLLVFQVGCVSLDSFLEKDNAMGAKHYCRSEYSPGSSEQADCFVDMMTHFVDAGEFSDAYSFRGRLDSRCSGRQDALEKVKGTSTTDKAEFLYLAIARLTGDSAIVAGLVKRLDSGSAAEVASLASSLLEVLVSHPEAFGGI